MSSDVDCTSFVVRPRTLAETRLLSASGRHKHASTDREVSRISASRPHLLTRADVQLWGSVFADDPVACTQALEQGASVLPRRTSWLFANVPDAFGRTQARASGSAVFKSIVQGDEDLAITPLRMAASVGSRAACAVLLEKGVVEGSSYCLHEATAAGHALTCELFFEKGFSNVTFYTAFKGGDGDPQVVRVFLQQERILSSFGPRDSRLLVAIAKGDKAQCEKLLAGNERARAEGERDEFSPLAVAALLGQEDICTLLLDSGASHRRVGRRPANPDDDDDGVGHAPIHIAARVGSLKLVALMLSRGAPQVGGRKNATPLHLAARRGAAEICNALAVVDPLRTLARDCLDATPLEYAVRGRHCDACRVLLLHMRSGACAAPTHRADVGSAYRSALAIAASCTHPDILAALVDGGEETLLSEFGPHALREAVLSKNARACEYLLRKGVAQVPNHDGIPLIVLSADAEVSRVLVQYGADVNARDQNGRTALHLAVRFGDRNEGLLAFLLSSGADANGADYDGWSPLHAAVAAPWSAETCPLLLSAGALVGATTRTGDTALHVASRCRKEDVCALLMRSGASAVVANASGATPLDVAQHNKDVRTRLVLETASVSCPWGPE